MSRVFHQPAGGHRAGAGGPSLYQPSLYQDVTDRIIAELEQGRVPWVQPWGRAKTGPGLPENAVTGRRYSGVNILILWGAVIAGGFSGQRWLTFRQALSLGGSVRKGAHGTTICYADRFIPKAEAVRVTKEGGTPDSVPFLKRFTVFNADQCEGLPEMDAGEPLPEREIVPQAEALIRPVWSRITCVSVWTVPACPSCSTRRCCRRKKVGWRSGCGRRGLFVRRTALR